MQRGQDQHRALEDALGRDCYRITGKERASLEAALSLSTDDLLRALVRYSGSRARVPISGFQVGSAGLTQDGEIFLGVNLEFSGLSLSQTVHSEQFLVSWSRSCSSSPLATLAVSAPPCGHCRQFMREFDTEGTMRILIGEEAPALASALLPRAFTPRDLGVSQSFFAAPLDFSAVDDLDSAARLAAAASYAPYSGMRTGLAARTLKGNLVGGASIENAAYNPTLPAFQAALVACHAQGHDPLALDSVVLCQESRSHIDDSAFARALAAALGVEMERFQVISL